MADYSYPPPVDRLLTYSDCRRRDVPNYVEELQLTSDHSPDLIRMAIDRDLQWADSDNLAVWAPVHAWRSLGQLRAEAAIEPLLGLFDELQDDDWAGEELPEVLGMIGAAAIAPVTQYLADSSHAMFSRIYAAHALQEIAKAYPESRSTCVEALTQELGRFWKNHPTFNGFLVSYLLNLDAVEAAPSIEQAYAAQRVDLSTCGYWEDVQVDLGLKSRAEVPVRKRTAKELREFNRYLYNDAKPPSVGFASPNAEHSSKKKSAKKKRKQERSGGVFVQTFCPVDHRWAGANLDRHGSHRSGGCL